VCILTTDPKSNEPPRRAWISVPDNPTSYRAHAELLTEAALQLAVMKKALADLEAWIDRYHSLEEICGSAMATARAALRSRLAASI
jgi:hypothetical protein